MAETVFSELHGKYYKQLKRGNIFMASTAVGGVVIPISTTLTPTFTLWNPTGSGVTVTPIALLVGWSATTGALGTIGYTYTANAGSSVGTTAPFVAFGTGAPINGILNGGGLSKARRRSWRPRRGSGPRRSRKVS